MPTDARTDWPPAMCTLTHRFLLFLPSDKADGEMTPANRSTTLFVSRLVNGAQLATDTAAQTTRVQTDRQPGSRRWTQSAGRQLPCLTNENLSFPADECLSGRRQQLHSQSVLHPRLHRHTTDPAAEEEEEEEEEAEAVVDGGEERKRLLAATNKVSITDLFIPSHSSCSLLDPSFRSPFPLPPVLPEKKVDRSGVGVR